MASGVWLLAGIGWRLALNGGSIGDRSAAVMLALLVLSAWSAAWLLGSPRAAFLVTLGLVLLLVLAAWPPRGMPAYDDRQALYRPDQVLSAQVVALPTTTSPVLTLLVEPVFSGTQPQFSLAGEVGGTPLAWTCTFQSGLQRLALPVPASAPAGAPLLDVRLHLTGSPTRESDYLLVYTSSARGGLLISLLSAGDVTPGATICQLSG